MSYMGIFDLFKKKKREEVELVGHSLEKLSIGDIIELDGETWEVKAKGYYDYGHEKEWDFKITSPTREGFLNKDEDRLYFFIKDDLKKLSLDIITYLKNHDDLPNQLIFDDKPYKLVYSSAAYYVKDGHRSPVVMWDFESEDGKLLEVLQWGDEDFEIYVGRTLEEWEIEDVFSR